MATYCALIRTYNSAATLPATLASLANQVHPPDQYIFVDSGSTDATLSLVPEGAIVHRFVGKEFNYAEALNQGLGFARTDFVLIISSHTSLRSPQATDFAVRLLEKEPGIGAAYFSHESTAGYHYRLIDRASFDGFNGIWNSCSLIRRELLTRRAFRAEVFTAEDQEWSRWLLNETSYTIARIHGGQRLMANALYAINSQRKSRNEYIAVAYYANPKLLRWRHIARLALTAVKPDRKITASHRAFNLRVVGPLVLCRFKKPKRNPRYF